MSQLPGRALQEQHERVEKGALYAGCDQNPGAAWAGTLELPIDLYKKTGDDLKGREDEKKEWEVVEAELTKMQKKEAEEVQERDKKMNFQEIINLATET